MKKPLPSYEDVSRLLCYEPETGTLVRVKTGAVAGTRHSRGYIYVSVFGQRYRASRLCWLLHHGRPPVDEIDHINRDGMDDRICNLREATRQQNNANRIYTKRKTCLPKGVQAKNKRFIAQITVNGKTRRIGYFASAEEAHAAYMRAAKIAFGDFARAA